MQVADGRDLMLSKRNGNLASNINCIDSYLYIWGKYPLDKLLELFYQRYINCQNYFHINYFKRYRNIFDI